MNVEPRSTGSAECWRCCADITGVPYLEYDWAITGGTHGVPRCAACKGLPLTIPERVLINMHKKKAAAGCACADNGCTVPACKGECGCEACKREWADDQGHPE